MIHNPTWMCATAVLFAAGLTACNSSSNSGNRGPDHTEHYEEIGLQPGELPDQAAGDEMRGAIQAGYVGFGTMMAMHDLRMGLQSYDGSFLPNAINRAVEVGMAPDADAGGEGAWYPSRNPMPCNNWGANGTNGVSGSVALFYWDGNGEAYAAGDEIRFGFQDCVPAGGAPRFTSDGVGVADPQVQRYRQSGREYRFVLNQVQVDSLPGFTLNGPLVREVEESASLQMTFSNRSFDSDTPGGFELRSQNDVRLRILGAEDGAEDVSLVRTRKPGDHVYFSVPNLVVHLARGEEEIGRFVFRTTEELVVDYGRQPAVHAGRFEVTAPDGTVYRFSADGTDGRELLVEADGEEIGQLDPRFLVNRLRAQ